ncbi:hypothetical protein [Nocardia heshunensis]
MAIPSQIERFHATTTALSSIAGPLTTESIEFACSVGLREVGCFTPRTREFQGYPQEGPFSIVTLRIPHRNPDRTPTLILTPRASVRIYQSDLEPGTRFSREVIEIDPRMPPEGTVSFRERRGDWTLVHEFTAQSRLLRKLIMRGEDRTGAAAQSPTVGNSSR